MVINNAWHKNNRRELKKTLGRFMAIVAIVALGVSILVGLQAAKPTMVKTCNHYLNDTDFFDLQLVSSVAFDLDAPDTFREITGVSAAGIAQSAAQMKISDPEIRMVYLAESGDTRYEKYSVLRSLHVAEEVEARKANTSE